MAEKDIQYEWVPDDDGAIKAEGFVTYNEIDDDPLVEDTYNIRVKVHSQNASKIHEANNNTKTILNNQKALLKLTNQIIQNQKQIMAKLTNLSARMDNASTKIDRLEANEETAACNSSLNLKQIKCIEDLEEFEVLVSNNDYKQDLIKSYLVVCTGGRGKGTNCAYRFLDILFSREFLCQCSWSGASRSDGVKISLKCYRNTLKFFFEMIQQWDPTYTLEANETFIKTILRNAKKRTTAKLLRMSSSKCRPRGGKRKRIQKMEDIASVQNEETRDDDDDNDDDDEQPEDQEESLL